MKLSLLFFLLLMLAISGCGEQTEKKQENVKELNAAAKPRIDFSVTDSIECYHFPDTKNQRVFDRSVIRDTALIRGLVNSLEHAVATNQQCDNNYKLFLYNNGEVFKTVYAATADSCRYLAYIVNGVNYYAPLTGSSETILRMIKK